MCFAFSRRLFLQKLSSVLIACFFFGILGGMLTSASSTGIAASSLPSRPNEQFKLGIDVLSQNQFQQLAGKRVGLLTHPAGINRNGLSTIEVLRLSPRVNLVALFGPEHGIYGNEKASVSIKNRIDSRTGLPVYSLYGKYRKPIPTMLEGLDALVIDLQDLGVRSYTFISCMRLAIEACFELFIVRRVHPGFYAAIWNADTTRTLRGNYFSGQPSNPCGHPIRFESYYPSIYLLDSLSDRGLLSKYLWKHAPLRLKFLPR